MAKGVNIPIAADARSVISEAKRVQDAFEDVVDSLDGVSRQSRTTGGDLDAQISAGARGAGDEADPLARTFREALNSVSRESKQAGDDLGRNVRHGAEQASEGTDALKENAGANAKEVAASFDGSAQSIADGFQGLAAEAFEGWGPAGLAAGVGVGAAMGLVQSQLQKAKEKAQEAAQEIADVASALIDLKSTDLDDAHIDDTLKSWAGTAENGKVKLDELAAAAAAAKIDFHDYARGVAGDNDAAKRSYEQVNAGLGAYFDGLLKVQQQYGFTSAAAQGYIVDHHDEYTALDAARKALLAQDATLDQAAQTYQEYMDATRGSTAATQDATPVTDANTEATQQNTDAQHAAREARHSLFDATTNLNEVVAASTDTLRKNKSAGLDPSTAAGRENRQALSDMAGAYETAADAITEAGGSQDKANRKIRDGRAAVIDAAKAMGYSKAEAKRFADQLGLIPTKVSTAVTATTPDPQAIRDALNKAVPDSVSAKVKVEVDDTAVKRWVKGMNGQRVYLNFAPRGSAAIQ